MQLRKSNFELLRIISIAFIVLFHCSYHSGFAFMGNLNPRMFTIKVFWMLGELGVNLFMLISGYFMVKSSFKWRKFILLICELYFYHFLTIAFAVHKNIFFINKSNILNVIFPFMSDYYWFFTAYIIVYLLSPYINVMLNNIDRKRSTGLVFSLLTVFSFIPTVYGSFFNNTEGFLYYNRMIWLVVVYIIGAHIRNYSPVALSNVRKSLLGFAATFVFVVLSIYAIDRNPEFFGAIGIKEEAFFWYPNTVPMVLMSFFFFGIFMNLNVPGSRIINSVASTTLGVYLLHDGILRNWIWNHVFRCAQKQYTSGVVGCVLKSALIVLVVGIAVDLVRQVLQHFTVNKIIGLISEKSKADSK